MLRKHIIYDAVKALDNSATEEDIIEKLNDINLNLEELDGVDGETTETVLQDIRTSLQNTEKIQANFFGVFLLVITAYIIIKTFFIGW
ncbi:MAG: hypothetical protein J6C96_00490 [Oscillospiraceae bacterium]|nr:hypothetical protein [Oscillospiraceae bacterium]